MVDAHAAVICRYQLVGIKDRRAAETHDLLLLVLFEGIIVEVQLHFKGPAVLKRLSHAAYNITRVDTSNLNGIRALIQFPRERVSAFTRDEVKPALQF